MTLEWKHVIHHYNKILLETVVQTLNANKNFYLPETICVPNRYFLIM